MINLKSLRYEKKMTQQQVADLVGMSLRSYKTYENDESRQDTLKYRYIVERLTAINPIDEEHGIVEMDYIIDRVSRVFEKYNVDFCYLFGSYAKGIAKPDSDVDLLVSVDLTGIKYFGFVEEIRVALNKKVDVLNVNQLTDNLPLLKEVLKDGMKIYG